MQAPQRTCAFLYYKRRGQRPIFHHSKYVAQIIFLGQNRSRRESPVASSTQLPHFEIGLLMRSATMAGIDPMTVPSDKNPWTWKDPRAQSWRSAIRVLNPVLADAAEAAWGPALPLKLQAALAGEIPWDADLHKELEARRPALADERREAATKAALEQMAESRKAEKEAQAERTPNPEQLRTQLIKSFNLAAAHQGSLHYGIE
jgi:hypothetical protein